MADFTHFYLVVFPYSRNKKVVKYGDTRDNITQNDLEKRYLNRSFLGVTKVHGNNHETSIGKKIQKEKMDNMVGDKLAVQINNTERYLVTNKICKEIIENWQENTKRNFASDQEISNIIDQFSEN